ncbi:SET domain-containing protein [Daldinia caldariorum]|uniref:SET domain-containing protein n=1 Tax=Daldinia caldariorum TaxID=326644 RepID=UPI002007E4E5|nr:SET domain-containing protein [Daldinia caldariorum]KAI1467952.1 SET domain-containing protein [Daldinia caldariorum]
MEPGNFPLDEFPTWCTQNGVYLNNVQVALVDIDERGNGLITTDEIVSREDDLEPITLMRVPRELILSSKSIDEFALEHRYFRQLLALFDDGSTRMKMLLFLLYQLVLSSYDHYGGILSPSTHWTPPPPSPPGALPTDSPPWTPWTQYFSLLPSYVPAFSSFTKVAHSYLRGTSLESAVAAKMRALTREFEDIQKRLSSMPFWGPIVEDALEFQDWCHVDALFRSRSLELPNSGTSMVPCIDLVNHSSRANAFYEQTSEGDMVLYLFKGCVLPAGSEITINYGHEKSAAEMLYNYGFIDPDSPVRSMTILLRPQQDDPIGLIKFQLFSEAFNQYPKLKLYAEEGVVPHWTGPFLYFLCLNEEDGLQLIPQQWPDGSQQWEVFWQGVNITGQLDTLKDLIRDHESYQVFELRVCCAVLGFVQRELDNLLSTRNGYSPSSRTEGDFYNGASRLKSLEADILRKCVQAFNEQVRLNFSVRLDRCLATRGRF